MKRKSLLFLLLFALLAPWAANAQSPVTVTIGEGTSSNYYPLPGFYGYQYDVYLYTPSAAPELGVDSDISSIAFQVSSNSTSTGAKMYIWVKDVDASYALASTTTFADYISGATQVYANEDFTSTVGWNTLNFSSTFSHEGGKALLVAVRGVGCSTGGGCSRQCYYTSAPGTWWYKHVDNSDPGQAASGAISNSRANIQLSLTYTGSVCFAPTGLTYSNVTADAATVSWTESGSSTGWVLEYGTASDYSNATQVPVSGTPSTPLSGLSTATTYYVRVQADCGSNWLEGSFSTDFCLPENKCNLTFVLTDSWGDSWNGNAIQVKDAASGVILATLANENLNGTSGSGENETQTVTLAVCDGRALEFSWISGSYVSEVQYTVTDINGEVIVEGSGAGFTTFNFTPSCTVTNCEKPQDVAVNYTGGTTATVTWAAHAESYSVDVNGTVVATGITDTEYPLTGLQLATTYEVSVQADCGADGPSSWTTPVSFKTDLCMPEDMCAITINLFDSYGDGWNGAYFLVYDYDEGDPDDEDDDEVTLLAAVTIEDGDAASYTLNVCDGRNLVFYWSEGSYDSECSYVVYDNLGDPICSGSDAMEDPELFYMNCSSTCRMPRNFAASEIAGRSVKLSWTELGEATSWTLAFMSENDTEATFIEDITTNPYTLDHLEPLTKYYAMISPNCEDQYKWSDVITWTTDAPCPKPQVTVDAVPTSAEVSWTGFADNYEFEWAVVPATETKDPYTDGNWYYYDNGTYVGSVGLGGGEFHWGVMFPAGTYEGTLVSKVKAYDINAMVGTLAIYNDGETAPANQISIQDVEFTGAGDWVEFTTNAIIDPSKNVWVVFDAVDGAAYPIGTSNDDNGDANGRWVEINGTWYDMANVGVTGRANMLRAYIESGIDPDELDWQSVDGATSPVTLSPLEPGTQYIVRIKALCGGDDGESEWTTIVFWTPELCDTPINLAAEVEATSATLSWSDYQESYNVRYRRTPYVATTYFSENFDEGLPTTWTTIDNDNTTVGNWIALSEINSVYTYYTSPLTGWAHSGADAVASASYVNGIGEVATDNYLVTPQVTFNGTLRFYATSEYSDPDTYEVLLSTTGNSISDFNVTLQAMGPATYGAWDEVIIDLSDYAGQQGYIAIHHVATDKYWLVIDDFGMYDLVYEDWTNVTATENTYTATGLTPEAEYEWQVQGVNCDGEGHNTDWTEVADFTTLEQTTLTQDVELQAGANWFSTYLDITLDDLKAALVAALPTGSTIKIKGQNGTTTYSRGRWQGSVAWNLSSMYIIIVPSDCEFTLEDDPIDPTELEITILADYPTYIGYPFSQSMTVTNAFAGFAVNLDKIKGQNGTSTYNRGRWNGSVTNLEPGKGYIYFSAYETDRPFVFTAPSKAKNNMMPTIPSDPNSVKRAERNTNTETMDLQLPQKTRRSAMDILSDVKKPTVNINLNK